MKTLNIAIIDDSEIIRKRLIEKINQIEGLVVSFEADDLKPAFDALNNCIPDIVILDINLPSGSGFDILKAIKENHPEVIVIMLTNFAFSPFRLKCCKMGGDHFLDKTNDFNKVYELLKKYVLNSNNLLN